MSLALWLPDVLAAAGLDVVLVDGWETRGRPGGITPKGHLWHHTVTPPGRRDEVVDRFLCVGRLTGENKLPGPLANISTNRDGSVSIIAAGRANHAGTGIWKGVSGNVNFIGDEMKNYGSGDPDDPEYEPWVPEQLESARISAAAILRHLGHSSATMLAGHKEYATPAGRKTDPHTLRMNDERLAVSRMILEPPEDTMWLPLAEGQTSEDVRLLKLMLNQAFASGLDVGSNAYDAATVAAVRVNLGHLTGSPAGKEGRLVVATMMYHLMEVTWQGERGPKGDPGTPGAKGDTGARGPKGDPGLGLVPGQTITSKVV